MGRWIFWCVTNGCCDSVYLAVVTQSFFFFFFLTLLFLSTTPLAHILHYDWLDDPTGVT